MKTTDPDERGGLVDGAEQAHPDHDEHHAADQPPLPQAGRADDPAAHDARDQEATDHADRHQAGLGGRHAASALEVLAEVDGRAEHRQADQHRRGGRQRRGAVAEQADRDDRVGRDAALDVHRGGQDGDAERHQQAGLERDPVELVAGQRHPHEQDADAGDEQRRAEVVDLDRALHDGQLELGLEHRERDDGDRQADEERAAPAERRVDHDAADQRAAHGGQREGGADVAGVAAALTRRDHRRDHDLHERGEAADAEALDDAGADQHLHARRDHRDHGADRVDDQRRLDEQLLGEEVRELAPDRGGRRHGEQRRDDHPGVAGLRAVEVGDDHRQRVGDDRARQHRHEHREQQAREGLEDLAVRHRRRGVSAGDAAVWVVERGHRAVRHVE